MAIDLSDLSRALAASRIRHHVDAEERVIRVVCATPSYENLRGERIAILRIEPACEGRIARVALARVSACGEDAAAACERLARVAASEPLVGVEFDAAEGDLRFVAQAWVEERSLSTGELPAMIDALIRAAETLAGRAGGKVAA